MDTSNSNRCLATCRAITRATRILNQMEIDGADFVGVDDTHAYIWHKEHLVNLYDHHDLIRFLETQGYLRKRTDNKMIIAAWIIFEGLRRCA